MHVFVPGIEFHRMGGHTDSLQVVRVMTANGWIVLASDAVRYSENPEKCTPFAAIFSESDMVAGFAYIRSLASNDRNIVPAHDPQVCERFPRLNLPVTHIYRTA